MLERTAGCLESGSLRRILHASKKPLKSRRMLHSTFWNHGAVELESSPLWTALIRGPEFVDARDEERSKPSVDGSPGVFLDFLYPSRALKFVREYSSWKSGVQDVQRARNGSGRLGQRLYTSLASASCVTPRDKSAILITADADEMKLVPATSETVLPSPKPKHLFHGLHSAKDDKDYDEAWKLFISSGVTDDRELVAQFLAYLSTSNRPVDAQRIRPYFGKIRCHANREDYGHLIKLNLKIGSVRSAVQLHKEALKKFDVPVAADMLLAHTLTNSQWRLACVIWRDFQNFRDTRHFLSYNVWKLTDRLPDLPDCALGLASYVNHELSKLSPSKTAITAPKFASGLVNRALLAMSNAETLEPLKLKSLLKVLENWNTDTPERYERLILSLLNSGHTKLAVQCYRRYRQRVTKKISRNILDDVLRVVCKHRSILGMQQVLDDWFRFYGRPSEAVYRQCMSAFAAQGDDTTVIALFDQYLKRVRQSGRVSVSTADDIAPLLHVHAVRGEISQVLEIFNGMEEKFGLQPNVKSWNILINAYGKVHDVKGAFDSFQRLLNSSIRPDTYTYGALMGICTIRGDLERALKLYQMAERTGIPRSAIMIDCLVLGHIQDDRLLEAEKICEDALTMGFNVPLTRMWNYLLTAYGMRRDLESTNRILRRMKDAGVDYDGSTYSALMQALAMVRQPDRANEILTKVMPESGMRVTSFHYAVVMGGYIATGELDKLIRVHNNMLKRNFKQTVSTRLMSLKASAIKNTRLSKSGVEEEQWLRAEQYFYKAYNAPDAQESIDSKKKGIGRQPLDVAYPSAHFGYLMFVLGQRNAFQRVRQLYKQYKDTIPKKREAEPPLKILSALMAVSLRRKDYVSVQKNWELAFLQATKQGQPIQESQPSEKTKVLPFHQLALAIPLSTQITSLARQRKYGHLARTIKEVEDVGFALENKNWNIYIQCLARSPRYKQAFELCENKLMEGWSGWARVRWMEPQRNRLPLELRYLRQQKTATYLRPLYHTLLSLAKVYLELHESAAESRAAKHTLDHLERRCPRVVHAVKTMQRGGDKPERRGVASRP